MSDIIRVVTLRVAPVAGPPVALIQNVWAFRVFISAQKKRNAPRIVPLFGFAPAGSTGALVFELAAHSLIAPTGGISTGIPSPNAGSTTMLATKAINGSVFRLLASILA